MYDFVRCALAELFVVCGRRFVVEHAYVLVYGQMHAIGIEKVAGEILSPYQFLFKHLIVAANQAARKRLGRKYDNSAVGLDNAPQARPHFAGIH